MNLREDVITTLRKQFREGATLGGLARIVATMHEGDPSRSSLTRRYIMEAFQVAFHVPIPLTDASGEARFALLALNYLPEIVAAYPKWRDLPGGDGPAWFLVDRPEPAVEEPSDPYWRDLRLLSRLMERLQRRLDEADGPSEAAGAATSTRPRVPNLPAESPASTAVV